MILQGNALFSERNQFTLFLTILILGVLTAFGMVLAAVWIVANFLMIVLGAVNEVLVKLTQLYIGGDSLTKLVLWLLAAFLIAKLFPFVMRSLRVSFQLA